MLHKVLTLTRPLIVFDFETCSTPEGRTWVVQLALHQFNPDGSEKNYKTLINPEVPIDEESARIHGITDAVIATGCARCRAPEVSHPHEKCETWKPVPRFRDIAENLHRGFTAADFAGQGIRFDVEVLEAEFLRSGLTFDRSKVVAIDTLRLEQVLHPRSLSDLYEKYTGQKLEDAHDAAIDVLATVAVLYHQLNAGLGKFPTTVAELGDLCFSKRERDPNWVDSEGKFKFIDGVPCVNFGKNRGKPMRSVTGLLRWILQKDFSAEVKLICQEALDGRYPTKQQSLPELDHEPDAHPV